MLFALPRPVAAEDPQLQHAEAPPEAMAHFERGREHFRAGRYREAIADLKTALALDPASPTLMYNVAYTHELLGEHDEAIAYYRKYLDALPASAKQERDKTRITLHRLEGHRAIAIPADRDPSAHTQPAAFGAPDARGFGNADAWFWGSLGGGAALLAGAAVTGLLALEREDRIAAFVAGGDGSLGDRQALIDEADRLALASDLLVGGGAALVTAAALLFVLRDADPEPPRATLTVGRRAAMLELRGRF